MEPYDPIGVAIGSFVFFPELETGALWNSNVLQSPMSQSNIAAELRPAACLVSKWSSHTLELRGTAALSYYEDFDSENDATYTVEVRGRFDVSKFTNVQAILSQDSRLESRSSIGASAIGSRSKVETSRAEAATNHRFNRLSLRMRGSISDCAYGDTKILGVTISNSDRDYRQTEQAARATWEFKPTLSAFAEVAINQRDYDQVAASDLINRSSNGGRYRLGLAFGNTSEVLRGEVSIGYGVQTPEDDQLHRVDGLILDANATWRMTELTSILFNARSDVTEKTTVNIGGAFSRSAGAEVRHALRRYLIASAGLAYSIADSQDGVIEDREISATFGIEYFVSPEAILFGSYLHTNFDSVGAGSDFQTDEVHLGVRIRR
ncbi:MAG: outer membrane beta-barrel protein [Hyphomicrobium sp.]